MAEREGRAPANLRLCRACDQFLFPGTAECPHCAADLDAADALHADRVAEARAAYLQLRELMDRAARG